MLYKIFKYFLIESIFNNKLRGFEKLSNLDNENGAARGRNYNAIINKLSAVNNNIRFTILEILKEYEKNNGDSNPLYSREINSILLSEYGIKITPQMLSQHLKQLESAGLIMEMPTKKEVRNKIGKRNVKGYVIREDAFGDLFLEVSFLSEELLSYFDMYGNNKLSNSYDHCVLTVFNGSQKGKLFKIHKDETLLIKANKDCESLDSTPFDIFLNDFNNGFSDGEEPCIKIFHDDDSWCLIDDSILDGAFIGCIPVEKGVVTKLKNHTFLKLYNCDSTLILYCSF